jgi:hypothetical protein
LITFMVVMLAWVLVYFQWKLGLEQNSVFLNHSKIFRFTFVALAAYYFACVAGSHILPSVRQYISDLNVQSVEMKGVCD